MDSYPRWQGFVPRWQRQISWQLLAQRRSPRSRNTASALSRDALPSESRFLFLPTANSQWRGLAISVSEADDRNTPSKPKAIACVRPSFGRTLLFSGRKARRIQVGYRLVPAFVRSKRIKVVQVTDCMTGLRRQLETPDGRFRGLEIRLFL